MLFSREAQRRLNRIALKSDLQLIFSKEGELDSIQDHLRFFCVNFDSLSGKFTASMKTIDEESGSNMLFGAENLTKEYENLNRFLLEINQAVSREYQFRINALVDEFYQGNCIYFKHKEKQLPVKDFLQSLCSEFELDEERTLEYLKQWVEENFEYLAYHGEFT
jgi:hypothetical protein